MNRWTYVKIRNNLIGVFWISTLFVCLVITLIIVPFAYPYVLIKGESPKWVHCLIDFIEGVIGEMMEWILGNDKV